MSDTPRMNHRPPYCELDFDGDECDGGDDDDDCYGIAAVEWVLLSTGDYEIDASCLPDDGGVDAGDVKNGL